MPGPIGCSSFLVTGATGWLGNHLTRKLYALPDAPPLRCLVLPGQDSQLLKKECPDARCIAGDLRDPQACKRFCADAEGAVLFHTAGVIHPRRSREFSEVNREATKSLLEAALRASVRRVVLVSSNSPCGCNPHPDHLFDERSPYRPYLGYGRSKMEMELAARAHAGRLEIIIVRAPWFYGPGQPLRQTLFFKLVRDGQAPIAGTGENLRSMVYLENLCDGLLLTARNELIQDQVYWIADERPYTMNEIVNTIERLLESEFGQKCAHRRLRLPSVASSIAYMADSVLQGLGFYNQKVHVLSEMNKTIACSVKKAKTELGYHPRIALEEGMRRSLNWCFETGALP